MTSLNNGILQLTNHKNTIAEGLEMILRKTFSVLSKIGSLTLHSGGSTHD